LGFTETKVLSDLDFLNTTLPFTTEKIIKPSRKKEEPKKVVNK